jgi:Putative Flp pilus-assembly TadE/G-like
MSARRVDDESRERGQVLVLFLLFMVVLLASAALAIDYSSWLVARRDYQAVADAAALAGAAQLPSPGSGSGVTSAAQQNAATDALVYLSDHLGWGIARATAQGATAQYLNQNAPYVVTAGTNKFCVWIWTPTPSTSALSGTDPTCSPASGVLYSPANYPGSSHKIFVRVQAARPSYFGGIVGIRSEVVSAIAVAGGVQSNYAVVTLKTRLGTSDNQFGLTISGNGTSLVVPVGNVGSNFSARCSSGSVGAITFPTLSLEQTLDAEEPPPTATCTNANITGGTIQQLPGYPIPDPDYFTPRPSWCTDASSVPFFGECQETSGTVTKNWDWAPAAIYPAVPTNMDLKNHTINGCNTSGTSCTIYPGKYENITIPGGVTATLSPNCYGDAADLAVPGNSSHTPADSDCISNGRAGIFYLTSSAPGAGISVQNGGTLQGCGVLTVFDPNEKGGSGKLKFNLSGGASIYLNDLAMPGGCTMKWDPGQKSGTTAYKWYGYNQPFQNPVTVWVRPNRTTYDLTSTNNGSNVIVFAAGVTLHAGGAIYAPEDNSKIAGGPSGSGVGQIVAWTLTYSGGSAITETSQVSPKDHSRLWQ